MVMYSSEYTCPIQVATSKQTRSNTVNFSCPYGLQYCWFRLPWQDALATSSRSLAHANEYDEVGLWDILYFPFLGLRGPYLLIFFRSFKGPTSVSQSNKQIAT